MRRRFLSLLLGLPGAGIAAATLDARHRAFTQSGNNPRVA
jgi:hypothetical protein